MSNLRKALSIAGVAVVLSASASFAQVGGADVPTDAKKQGTKENGPSSTGMSKGEANGMKKDGMMKDGGMKKDNKM